MNWGWLAAFGFGCLFDWYTARLSYDNDDREFVELLLAIIGIIVVLLIAALTPDREVQRLAFIWRGQAVHLNNHQHAVVYLLPFFAAAGAPLIAGALWRAYWRK